MWVIALNDGFYMIYLIEVLAVHSLQALGIWDFRRGDHVVGRLASAQTAVKNTNVRTGYNTMTRCTCVCEWDVFRLSWKTWMQFIVANAHQEEEASGDCVQFADLRMYTTARNYQFARDAST